MAKISFPPPTHEFQPNYYLLESGTFFQRIYDPTTKHKVTATSFRYFGPLSRFDHQKRVEKKPSLNSDRGIIYGGFTLSCCLVEIFAEDGFIEIGEQELATITINKNLKLLDIRVERAWNAGTTVATVNEGKRNLTQAWGRYFYDNPKIYGNIAGLIYNSANNGEEAIALYERAECILTDARVSIQKMRDTDYRREIYLAAKTLGIPVKFL